jgi:hypothetical protein
MAKWVRFLSSLVCAGALSLLARPAAADEPATAGALQWGLGFRYGFELEEGDIVNPFGTGLGAELGYTFPVAVYVGGNFDYFFGEEQEILGTSTQANLWQLMAEGGYDIAVAPVFVIRPKLGVGFANSSIESCAGTLGCADDSSTNFALAPGAKFMLLTENFGLSADLRYDMVFAEETTLNALILSIGIGF